MRHHIELKNVWFKFVDFKGLSNVSPRVGVDGVGWWDTDPPLTHFPVRQVAQGTSSTGTCWTFKFKSHLAACLFCIVEKGVYEGNHPPLPWLYNMWRSLRIFFTLRIPRKWIVFLIEVYIWTVSASFVVKHIFSISFRCDLMVVNTLFIVVPVPASTNQCPKTSWLGSMYV